MHIAIDAHSVGTQLGGNETYATNLIEALAQIDQSNRYTLYVTKREAIDRFANRWPNFAVIQTLPHTPLVRIPLVLARELRRRPVDLLHVQYTAPPLAPCPVVTTIHDLSFEHLPETFNRRSWMQLRFTVRRTARRSACIITSSEFSRRDIVETYNIAPERVIVTPQAAPAHFSPVTNDVELKSVQERYGLTRDYILSLCSIQPRKNLVRLIESYDLLRAGHADTNFPQLVLAGKKGWLDRETFRAAEQSRFRHDIIFPGYISDESLPALFSAAVCFVYPSYFEGFGLPVVEAMQCGAAVIVGNQTSLPEIVGDAGMLVDPFDVQAIANAMKRMTSGADERARFRAKAVEKVKEFSWIKTAQMTLAVYNQIAKHA